MRKIPTLTIRYIVKYPKNIHTDLSETTWRHELSLTLYPHNGVLRTHRIWYTVKYNEILPEWKVKLRVLSSREDYYNTLELGQALLEFEGKNYSYYCRNVTAIPMYYTHYCAFCQCKESWCNSGLCTFLSVCVNGITTRHEASPIRNPQECAAMTSFLRILFPQCATQTHGRWRREIQMCAIFQADRLTITLGRRRKWRQFSKELKDGVTIRIGFSRLMTRSSYSCVGRNKRLVCEKRNFY
jgi:hypothetical protein